MGEFKVDHATIAFRLALAEASEQEQARADALTAFWQRPVFAATWPSPNEAPRTLTNSQGETALPLFTGLDTLELGADRFSWREPNGSIRFREMSARDALRYALTRQVNFVVVDVGFEHNVEFARAEVESLVQQNDAPASREAAANPELSAATSSAAAQPTPTPRPQSSVTVSSPTAAVSSQASAAQARAGAQEAPRSDQPASPQSAQPARPRSDQPAYASAASSQPARPRSDQPAPAPSAAATPLRAAARAIPQQAPAQGYAEAARARASSSAAPSSRAADSLAPKHPSSVPPNLPIATAGSHDAAVSPRLQSGAVAIQQPPAAAAPQEAAPRQRSGAVPIQPPPSVRPEAPDSNAEPAHVPAASNPARSQRAISVPTRRPTISASPPPPSAYPPQISETASTIPPQQAEPPHSRSSATAAPPPRASGAAARKPVPDQTHPQASFVPQPHSHTPPVHTPKAPTPAPAVAAQQPSSQPTTPPPRASRELRRTPPPVPEAAKSRTPSTPGTPAPISNPPFAARPVPANDTKSPEARRRTRDDEPTLAERPNRANTQRGLQASVPDSTLEALSSELRGFPEVEWACVLVDESDLPLIGVRIDPSFLNRVADITDVILDIGERQSVTLQVMLLNNQEQVKNARRNGRAFYPWSTAAR